MGTCHQPHSARSCKLAWRALGAAQGRTGGGRLLPRSGLSGVGRSSSPDRPSLRHAVGACYPLAVGAGAVGVGTRHQPDSARSCELAFRAVGSARGRPGQGAPLAWVSVVRGWALPHARPPVLRACGRGPLPTCYRCPECGHGDPSPTPQRALLRAGLVCFESGMRAPRGGCLLPGCRASRVGRSPLPERPSLGRAVGARYPLAVGARGVGLGTCHQSHGVRSCKVALPTVGAA